MADTEMTSDNRTGRSRVRSRDRGVSRSSGRSVSRSRSRGMGTFVFQPIVRSGGYNFQSMSGSELNFVDTAVSSAAVSTTPYSVLTNGIAAGSSASQRIGRKITIKSVQFAGAVSPGSTTNTTNITRHVLVLDRQPNAQLAAFTDVYDSASPFSLRNISNMSRFQVVWDSGLIQTAGNATTAGQQTDITSVPISFYKKLNIPVQYGAAGTNGIGDINTNSLIWFSIGDGTSGGSDNTIAGNLRLRYQG